MARSPHRYFCPGIQAKRFLKRLKASDQARLQDKAMGRLSGKGASLEENGTWFSDWTSRLASGQKDGGYWALLRVPHTWLLGW
jgi:hypothetical protein